MALRQRSKLWHYRGSGALALALLLTPTMAPAQTIYVGRGAAGEVSFSDQPSPGTERRELVSPPAAAPSAAASVDTLLRVADALAEARREREADRRSARAAAVPVAPVPPVAPALQTPLVVPVLQRRPVRRWQPLRWSDDRSGTTWRGYDPFRSVDAPVAGFADRQPRQPRRRRDPAPRRRAPLPP